MFDAQDRLTSYGPNSYTYTPNGELLTKTDASGTTTYTYDFFGSLIKAELPGNTVIDYLLDGQHRRIGKRVNGTLVQGLLYSGQLAPVAELNGAGQVVSRFVYATHTNVPDYLVKGAVTYRVITDQLGSVRLVVNTSTGAVVQRLTYDEYGQVTENTSPGFQPFGYAGGLLDDQTSLVRFGAGTTTRSPDAGQPRTPWALAAASPTCMNTPTTIRSTPSIHRGCKHFKSA